MIERFNFFDIYGYLLPGGFLLLLIWVPIGLATNNWPSADWGSAILGLGLAYIAGHVLRILSEVSFPTEFKDATGIKRKPSDLLLDKHGDGRLPSQHDGLKKILEKQISKQFEWVKVDVEETLGWGSLEKQLKRERDPEKQQELKQLVKKQKAEAEIRTIAFLLCRSYLIQHKAASYAEQMQGMHELLRGMAASLALAFALYFGLGIGLTFNPAPWLIKWSINPELALACFFYVFASVVILAAWCSFCPKSSKRARWIVFCLLNCILFLFGARLAHLCATAVSQSFPPCLHDHEAHVAILAAMIVLALSLLCAAASRSFAVTFVATVYRDFSVIAPK